MKVLFKNIGRNIILTKMSIMEALNFRLSYFLTCIGNFVYFVIIFFLWRTIYESNQINKIKGMTLNDTIVYLVLTTAVYRTLDCFLVSSIDSDIKSGKISLDLLQPMYYPVYMFFKKLGTILVTFISTFVPVFIIVLLYSKEAKKMVYNLHFFLLSLFLSIILSYLIDFFVATICLHTQSGWGINMLKQVFVQVLSGVLIPVAFFSDSLKKVIYFLPFQAIYNIPMKVLLCESLYKNLYWLSFQLIWIFILILIDYIFWKRSIRVITVNGG